MTDEEDRMDRAERIRRMREGRHGGGTPRSGDESGGEATSGASEETTATDEDGANDAEDDARDEAGDHTDETDGQADEGDEGGDDPEPPAEADEQEDGDSGSESAPDADAESAAVTEDEDADAPAVSDDGAEVPEVSGGDSEVGAPVGAGDATAEEGEAASALARRGEASASTDGEPLLVFELGDERYGIEAAAVMEIVKAGEITRVPNTPGCVAGVFDLRGQVTAVVDPKTVLDGHEENEEGGDLIVVLDGEALDRGNDIGWIVDEVLQVRFASRAELTEPPEDRPWIEGVLQDDDGFVLWTTPEMIFEASPEIAQEEAEV